MNEQEAKCKRRRLIYSVPLSIVTFAAFTAAPLGFISQAGADGVTQSTMTLTATPSSLADEGTPAVVQSTTLKATVSILNPVGSLIVTPSGPVAFSVGSTSLGSANLGNCSVGGTTCYASITTNKFPIGTSTVLATYHTDGFASSNTATTTVTVTIKGSPTNPWTTTCTGSGPCDSGVVTAEDGSADIDVKTNNGSGTYTITSSLGGTTMTCTAPNTGASGNYVVSSSQASQQITYRMLGTAADNFHNTANAKTCYGTTQRFAGSTYNSTNQEYEGTLPNCTYYRGVPTNSPCTSAQTFVPNGGPQGQDVATLVVQVAPTSNPCDPHVTGGP